MNLPIDTRPRDYRALTTVADVLAYLAECKASGALIGVDTETTGTRRWHDDCVGISISHTMLTGRYVPVAHVRGPNVNVMAIRDAFVDVLGACPIAMHNSEFDRTVLARLFKFSPQDINLVHDTMTRAQVCSERAGVGSTDSAGLKEQAEKHIGVVRPSFKDLFPIPPGKKSVKMNFAELDIAGEFNWNDPHPVPYAAADADDVLSLVAVCNPRMDEAQKFIYGLEMSLHKEMAWMEDRGVRIDTTYAESKAMASADTVRAIDVAIFDNLSTLLGRPIGLNLASDQQLKKLLFSPAPEGLGLPVLKQTPGGNASADEQVLDALARHHEWLRWLLDRRGILKLTGTYLLPIPQEHVTMEDGIAVLHPSYRQLGTETGRMSSNDPNVQNFPKSQTFAENIPGVAPFTANSRDMAIAREGHCFVEMDWSQVEYRVVCGLSGDPALLATFDQGIDLHISTASLMFGIPVDQVSKAYRQHGKTLNYAMNFGAGVTKIAQMVGASNNEARLLMSRWEGAFPRVTQRKEQVQSMLRRSGVATTFFGRTRKLPSAMNRESSDRGQNAALFAALREGVNHEVQGTAADLLKITLVRLGPWLRQHYPGVRTVLTTHDSITFEVPDTYEVGKFISDVRPAVEFPRGAFGPTWPAITSDFGHGTRWGSLRDLGEEEDSVQEEFTPQISAVVDRSLVLEVSGDLTEDQVGALFDFLPSLTGPNPLCMHYQGERLDLPAVSCGPDDGYLFAHILPGAKLRSTTSFALLGAS